MNKLSNIAHIHAHISSINYDAIDCGIRLKRTSHLSFRDFINSIVFSYTLICEDIVFRRSSRIYIADRVICEINWHTFPFYFANFQRDVIRVSYVFKNLLHNRNSIIYRSFFQPIFSIHDGKCEKRTRMYLHVADMKV